MGMVWKPSKIATLADVREINEGSPVEIWLGSSGRAVVRAYNECGNNYTEVDLLDLLDWSRGNVRESTGGIPTLRPVE